MSKSVTIGFLRKVDFQKVVDNNPVDLFILTNKNGIAMDVLTTKPGEQLIFLLSNL